MPQAPPFDPTPSVKTEVRAKAPSPWVHPVHLWGTAVGIGLQPISTATGNIGFVIALLCALPSLTAHTVELGALWTRGWVRFLLAWLAWTAMSLIWSPDRMFGLEEFRATRVLLWIPVIWPIRHAWRPLVGAMLVGTMLMAAIQLSQVSFRWPKSHFAIGAGLTTPTQTGLWAAVALSFWLILAVSARLSTALLVLPCAALSGLSLVWSATRASAIGMLVELLVANVVLVLTTRGWLMRAALRCLVGLVILAAAVTFAGDTLRRKASRAADALQSPAGVTTEVRVAMWEAALEGWRRAPLAGVGAGGIPSIMEGTNVTTPKVDLRTVRMIHSTYLQTLAETGVIGLGLFLGFATLLFRDVLRGMRDQPPLVAAFGALIVWFVAAAFDGFRQSGGFLSVGAILIPLALADLRRKDVPPATP